MKITTIGAMALTTVLATGSVSAQGVEMTVFDWSGYEDQGFYSAYMEKYGEAPSYTYFGSQEEAYTKLVSGFTPDLGHQCLESVNKWVASDLVQPIDISKLKNWDALLPEIKAVDGLSVDGELYMVPFEWGNTGLIYRTDKIADDVISLQLLTDPAYQGKVTINDSALSAYAMAALATGSGDDYTTLSDEQFEAASEYLRAVHPNIRFYWSDAGQVDQAMASGEVEMAWAWNQTELNLIANETPAKMMRDIDKGIATWVCGYMHLKDSAVPDEQIYDFFNAVTEPASGKYIIESWGYPHSNAESFAIADQELIKAYGFDNPAKFFDGTLLFNAPVPEVEAKMLKEFERIKAGF